MGKKIQGTERVHSLVTFGAAKPGLEALTNPATGNCFDGYRFVNQDTLTVDPVPALLGTFAHPKMISIKMNKKSQYWEYPCDDNRQFGPRAPRVGLHNASLYASRVAGSNLSQETIGVAVNGLAISYISDVEEVTAILESGWTLIGTSHDGDDCAHLIQNEKSECILTFQGTNDKKDWWTNIAFAAVPFCNLNTKIHNGFRSEVMRVVQQDGYVNTIKPKLSSCSKITVTGHSLGGAMASIFSACANNEAAASDDENFTAIKWW